MASKGEQGVTRFSVSLPNALLEELDRRVTRRGYASRSELVRDLIRERLVEDQWSSGRSTVVGVLAIAYDHNQPGLSHQLAEIQHGRYTNVLCSTHVHLDRENCLEVIIIRGRPSEIEKIALGAAGLRGVRFAKLTRASTVPV
ncbi:MAG: nickel-responsive transcriptional regulator NikR [Candidatus Dadabacteria bacterium]|nr:MAG: nickel-responsive transcriptional regulator NikR [Candidatus Dadabacteria bacterium]